ncbi:MAG: enoyl-CoA hydratase [Akkermansiaceae bacterium]|nr:enoyl-CoA hydratase [Akkermansiaceae bacterium]
MNEILTERSGGILRVQFNRPERKNAMTAQMYLSLADVLDRAMTDDHVRAILWHGGGDCFCAGNDLEDFLKNPPGAGESPQARLIRSLMNFDKQIVAAVHGAAIGGGTTMLTHCDFVFAGESSTFQMPFINLGLVPEFGTTCSVVDRVGYIRAAELIFLGQPFDARRALELGFVTRIVPDQGLLATATEVAQQLAEKPADALRESKRLMKRRLRKEMDEAVKLENEAFAALLQSSDAAEAIQAFMEKRRPDFSRSRNVHKP